MDTRDWVYWEENKPKQFWMRKKELMGIAGDAKDLPGDFSIWSFKSDLSDDKNHDQPGLLDNKVPDEPGLFAGPGADVADFFAGDADKDVLRVIVTQLPTETEVEGKAPAQVVLQSWSCGTEEDMDEDFAEMGEAMMSLMCSFGHQTTMKDKCCDVGKTVLDESFTAEDAKECMHFCRYVVSVIWKWM